MNKKKLFDTRKVHFAEDHTVFPKDTEGDRGLPKHTYNRKKSSED